MKPVYAVLLGVLAACSSPPAVPAPPPASTSATTSTASSAPVTTTTNALPPHEGRELASCADGACRVDIVPGDRIPLPAGEVLVVGEIAEGRVTMQMGPFYGDITAGTHMSYAGHTFNVTGVTAGHAELRLQPGEPSSR